MKIENETVKAVENFDYSEYGKLGYLVRRGCIAIAEHVTTGETLQEIETAISELQAEEDECRERVSELEESISGEVDCTDKNALIAFDADCNEHQKLLDRIEDISWEIRDLEQDRERVQEEYESFFCSVTVTHLAGECLYGSCQVGSGFWIHFCDSRAIIEIRDYETSNRFYGLVPNICGIARALYIEVNEYAY